MKSFISEYGLGLFTMIVIILLIMMASPVSNKIHEGVKNSVDSFYKMTAGDGENPGIMQNAKNQLLELSFGGNKEENIPKSVYAAYNSSTKTLVFSNKESDSIYKACDTKYGNIYEDAYASNSEVPWSGVAKTVESVNIVNKIKPKNTAFWFYNVGYSSSLSSVDLNNLYTSDVTDMQSMFKFFGYNKLEKLELGSNFDTSNVTNMSQMFRSCGYGRLTTLTLGPAFNTSKVTDMSFMFTYTGYRSLDSFSLGSNFNTGNVTTMSYMFNEAGGASANFKEFTLGSKFDTSNVTDMSFFMNWFGNKLTAFTFGDKFDTSKVENMEAAFSYSLRGSDITKIDFGEKFSTEKVTNLKNTFNTFAVNATEIYFGNFNPTTTKCTSCMIGMNVNAKLYFKQQGGIDWVLAKSAGSTRPAWTEDNMGLY